MWFAASRWDINAAAWRNLLYFFLLTLISSSTAASTTNREDTLQREPQKRKNMKEKHSERFSPVKCLFEQAFNLVVYYMLQ